MAEISLPSSITVVTWWPSRDIFSVGDFDFHTALRIFGKHGLSFNGIDDFSFKGFLQTSQLGSIGLLQMLQISFCVLPPCSP